MYGTNLQLFILRCRVCHRWIAVRVDPDDLRRHYYDGVYVQHAFPYLSFHINRDAALYPSVPRSLCRPLPDLAASHMVESVPVRIALGYTR